MTTLYPAYKQAAVEIAKSERTFFSDRELADMLMEELDTKNYQFAKMKLNDYLLNEYHIDFIRSENEHDGKGYKKATSQESIEVTADRLTRRVRNTVHRQRRIIDIVDRQELTPELKDKHDKYLIRNGLMISFLNKTPLSRCIEGATVNVDVPKMITG